MSRTVAHAVELALDDDAQRAVATLFGALAAAGIEPLTSRSRHVHAHVSVTVATEEAPARLAAVLAGVAAAGLPSVQLSSIGAFVAPVQVVYLGVTPTAALLELNARVHDLLGAAGVATWPLYSPSRWVPHCTVAMRPASIAAAMAALAAAPLPIDAASVELRVVEVPTGRHVATVS